MRVRRSILNFGTSALFLLVTMLVGLKAQPYLRAWLTDDGIGGYKVVFDGLGYLTLLEMGLGGAVAPLMARAIGQDDEETLRATVTAAVRAYAVLSVVTMAVGLALTPIVPRFASDLAGAQVDDLRRGWTIGLFGFLTLALLPLRSVLEARQLGYVVNLLMTIQAVFITGTSLWLAHAGWGITGQATAQAVGTWALGLVLAAIVLRSYPGLLRAVFTAKGSPEVRRSLRSLSAPSLIINVCGRVSLLTDNLVVGAMLGARSVASLYYTQRLVTIGQGVLVAVGNASWAAMAELHAKGEHETFNRRLVEISRLVAILGAAGLAPVVAFNESFVRIWLPGQSHPYAGDLVTALTAVNVVMLAELSLWSWCLTATGRIAAMVPPTIVGAVVNLTGSILFTRWLGLPGPLLGTTLAFLATTMWIYPVLLRRIYGASLRALAGAVVPAAVLGLSAGGTLRWVAHHVYQPAGWFSLVGVLAASGLAILGFGWFLLSPDERGLWTRRLGRRAAS